jgi:hypothetical protein
MPQIERRVRQLQQLGTNDSVAEAEQGRRSEAIPGQSTVVEAPNTVFSCGLKRICPTLNSAALGAVALFAAYAVVCILLGSSCSGNSNIGEGRGPYQPQSVVSAYSKNGDIGARVTIDGIADPAFPPNDIGFAAPGNRYVAVEIAVQNVGQGNLNTADFRLKTSDGKETEPKPVPDIGATDLSFLNNLSTGDTTDGIIAFEVPEEATVQWLRFSSNPPGVEITFAVGN